MRASNLNSNLSAEERHGDTRASRPACISVDTHDQVLTLSLVCFMNLTAQRPPERRRDLHSLVMKKFEKYPVLDRTQPHHVH